MATAGVTQTKNGMPKLLASLKRLPRRDVLVGYPADDSGEGARQGTNLRTEPVNAKGDVAISDLTNAQIAYIHENGAPEAGIPPRPSLIPGVRDAKDKVVKYLKQAAKATLDGNEATADKALNAAGLAAADSVRMKIRTGPFVPLKPATIARRRIRSKGSKYRRKAVVAADTTPLIDTAQMLRAVTHVVRDVK